MTAATVCSEFPGTILHSAIPDLPVSYGETWHLARMDTGEYALVQSWVHRSPLLGDTRRYSIYSRIGSHPTIEQALARFDRWIGPGKQSIHNGPEC